MPANWLPGLNTSGNMTILVSYDIADDRLRVKTANKMLEYGLIRLQLSVFAGAIADTPWKQLLGWIQKEIVTQFAADDKLLYLPLTEGQSSYFTFLPATPDEWLQTVNPPNTLFI